MVRSKKAQRIKETGSPQRRARRTMRESDYAALAHFRFQIRSFLAFSEAAAAQQGLTPTQHQALLGIKGFVPTGPATIGDVARFLLIRHHSAVELIDRLAKLGLVSRVADPADARRVHLKLTRTGERKLKSLSQKNLEELRRAASPAFSQLLGSFEARAIPIQKHRL